MRPHPPAPALVIQHVEWEGPHRIAGAMTRAGVPVVIHRPLAGEPLPPPRALAAAVVMGGPMNVDDVRSHPGLAAERAWVEDALAAGLPMLGVCLGAQLLARALGARVTAGARPEIGWAPVRVDDADDPVLGRLAPVTEVLHWHGDVFDTPPGARRLAESDATACQAFRYADAWGVLFHAEADAALLAAWLAEPMMLREARAALGPDAAERLAAGADAHGPDLVTRSAPGLRAFAALAADRARALAGA
jgi:GMP synthase (glutamine-hydrolysing)